MNVWKIAKVAKIANIAVAVVIIIFGVPLFAVEEIMPPPDPLNEQLINLKSRLALDESQTAMVREILQKEQAAAVKDRETFGENALNLIQAAYKRKNEKEKQMEVFLNSFQKEKFKEIMSMTRFDRDLFELSEGLMLNDEQLFTVEGILIDYNNKIKEIMPEEMWDMPGPGRIPQKGLSAPRELGAIKRMMSVWERKKNNSIRKILTPPQEKLFEQIQKDRAESGKKKD